MLLIEKWSNPHDDITFLKFSAFSASISQNMVSKEEPPNPKIMELVRVIAPCVRFGHQLSFLFLKYSLSHKNTKTQKHKLYINDKR